MPSGPALFEVDFRIAVCGLDAFVAKPEGDDGGPDCKSDGSGVMGGVPVASRDRSPCFPGPIRQAQILRNSPKIQ